MTALPARTKSPTIPELGGALGRVAAARFASGDDALDGIRIGITTNLFKAAGEARRYLRDGQFEQAVAALDRTVWLGTWERAVTAAGTSLSNAIESQFQAAAAEARMSPRLLARFTPTEPERRAITAHIGKGTRNLELALDSLQDAASRGLHAGQSDAAAFGEWTDALDLCARRVEAAWIELEGAARKEEARWSVEVAAVRRWRRPRWPMWTVTVLAVAVMVYLGLVAGGFIPPPDFLRPWAEFWWTRL